MASNLTGQVRNIAEVATAVARGDLSRKITVDVKGEILELKNTINTMVDQLNGFASEVTRVAREVGTEGKLGGQAQVPGVAGTWKDLTDNVNSMASNLTARSATSPRSRPPSRTATCRKKITVDVKGEILELKNTINTMVDQLNAFASEVSARRARGRHRRQARRPGAGARRRRHLEGPHRQRQLDGVEPDRQVRNIAEVTTAVANGDLSQEDHRRRARRDSAAQGHHQHDGRSAATRSPSKSRASRARSAPKASSAARPQVPGVAGTWKDLTDNVNSMASNLTGQVRNIADVATAIARGDLSRKITVDVKGEILELKNTINTMVDQLNAFASEVSRVAREVGTEGKLGGQAPCPASPARGRTSPTTSTRWRRT